MTTAPPPLARGVIEVDTFCPGCQYNLHGQSVAVDERLGFPVCRCPECGRFTPAGVGVSAGTVWVRRLATTLLLAWVVVVLAGAAGACLAFGLLSVATVEAYSRYKYVTPDGRDVYYRRDATGTHWCLNGSETPVPSVIYAKQLQPIWPRRADVPGAATLSDYQFAELMGPGPTPWAWITAGSLVAGTAVGAACVTLLWHWPRRRYAWCLLVPAAAALFLVAVHGTNSTYVLCRAAADGRTAVQFAVQCVGVVIGLIVGRSVARAVVRTVVPPKPRQAIAFLWQADGLPMPAVDR